MTSEQTNEAIATLNRAWGQLSSLSIDGLKATEDIRLAIMAKVEELLDPEPIVERAMEEIPALAAKMDIRLAEAKRRWLSGLYPVVRVIIRDAIDRYENPALDGDTPGCSGE